MRRHIRKLVDHFGGTPAGAVLEVFHSAERRVVAGLRRPDHAVVDHTHVVVVLVAIGEGVVHAHVRQTTDEEEGRRPQAFEEYLQIGAEEQE